MIIILEGADLVGKTTLAKALSERLNIPQTGIWVDLNYPKPAVISVSKTIKMILNSLRPDMIFDRSFMSEWVYSRIMGREHDYINDLIIEWGMVDNLFLIVLYANDDVLRERYAVRGDNYLGINDILKVNDAYKELYAYAEKYITSMLFDITNLTVDEIVNNIMEWINNAKVIKE